MVKLRVGTVPYLNAVPLSAPLEEREDVELLEAVPSLLAERLCRGELDVAILPVGALVDGTFGIVPGVSIACWGKVMSVCLFSRRPLEEVRTVALDPSSRTSVLLARLLIEGRLGLRPEYVRPPLGAPMEEVETDAAVVIGDPALRWSRPDPVRVDLGEEWSRASGLPFVFAVWAVRSGVEFPGLVKLFQDAKRIGQDRLDQLAKREARRRRLPTELCRRYLREAVRFELGHWELAGLKWFFTLAWEQGLIPFVPEVDRRLLRLETSERVEPS
ncbi:MAG: chorismate dehydratase [Candidatus Poribacteria bacterium]|nr:MAG: chorismate dehydratase [Candidatus Poribacteria bacterium]